MYCVLLNSVVIEFICDWIFDVVSFKYPNCVGVIVNELDVIFPFILTVLNEQSFDSNVPFTDTFLSNIALALEVLFASKSLLLKSP